MECDVAGAIRDGGFEELDQIPNSIEIKAITNPLQILENGVEGEHPEAHHRRSEARHTHISTNVDKKAVSLLCLHLLEQVLHRGRDVGAAEGLPLESADDVLVGLVGQSAEVGERIEEGEFEALDGVGDDGVGLRGGEAVEGLEGSVAEEGRGFDGDVGISGGRLGSEVEEGEEKEGGGDEEEEVFGAQDFGGLVSSPRIRHGSGSCWRGERDCAFSVTGHFIAIRIQF